jgi:Zn-dependent protease
VFGSFKLGSVLGISVRMHVLLAVLGVLLYLGRGPAGALGFAVLFAAVFAHELGHALMARRLGLGVADITLGPIVSMARIHGSESSRVEALVAAAGPAVNLALAALAGGVALALHTSVDALLAPRGTAAQLLAQVLVFNLLLGVLNLVPAFPTDGGRILRAWLARRHGWLAATESAVRIGSGLAFVCAVAGLFGLFSAVDTGMQLWGGALVIVAAWVWWTGRQELARVRARHGATTLEVFAELLRRSAASAEAHTAAQRAAAEEHAARGLSDAEIAELERHRGPLGSWRGERR